MLIDTSENADVTDEVGVRRSADAPRHRLRLADLDGRTRGAKRANEVLETIISERGGRDRMNMVQLKSAEAYAVLTAMIEGIGAGWLVGQEVDANEYATLLNARRREQQVMGGPEPRDVTPGGNLRNTLLAARA
ncbi:hypothetical protein [Bradyrhizobium tunisiense]|uniref:hypothetical protein n=1 Tax=Bradyrhizobium tunisiense TaxID=3278709 RepID=UPI0035DAB7D3